MGRTFHITGSRRARRSYEAAIFCDGSADASFREGVDLELSHWNPNCTPSRFRADTSTEICMRFAKEPDAGQFDLVVNNHVDVDGVLSVFVLVEPELALAHRATIVAAAEMGDFWSWGDEPAQTLFQGLTILMDVFEKQEVDSEDVYARCFERVRELLAGADDDQISAGRAALARSVALIESGRVRRTVQGDRFAAYVIPRELAEPDLAAALRVPSFNERLSSAAVLLPHARNRFDKEHVQLVSVESASGWYHDVWYPGYMWADTQNVWRAPGFRFADSTNAWFYGHAPLTAALERLRGSETAPGTWTVVEHLLPFKTLPGRNFPVVVSFLSDGGEPAPSSVDPDTVSSLLAPAFDEHR